MTYVGIVCCVCVVLRVCMGALHVCRYLEGRVDGLVEGLLDVFELADNMPKAKVAHVHPHHHPHNEHTTPSFRHPVSGCRGRSCVCCRRWPLARRTEARCSSGCRPTSRTTPATAATIWGRSTMTTTLMGTTWAETPHGRGKPPTTKSCRYANIHTHRHTESR